MADEEYETIVQDDPSQVAQAEAVLTSIQQQINSSQYAQGMKAAASFFPTSLKSPQLKQRIVETFTTLFSQFTATDAFVKELTAEQQSNILAYATRIMANGDKKACDGALSFFAHITKGGNAGAVSRVIVNRRL